MANPNPHGANQYTNDPRQQLCWDLYVVGLSLGIDNAYSAAKEAGYEEETARNITLAGWFMDKKDGLKRKEMLSLAEKVLQDTLTMNTSDPTDATRVDHQTHKIKVDVAKLVATTQGKDLGYASRNEVTGKNGGAIAFEDAPLTEDDMELLEYLTNYERDRDTKAQQAPGDDAEPLGEEAPDQE